MSSGYQYHQVPPNRLREDSGFKESPLSHSMSPAQGVPPPVRLDKHPSLRKQRSTPCRVPRSSSSVWSSSPSESYDRDPSQSYGHSVGSFNDDELFDERATSRQSVSVSLPDEGYSESEESGSGQFTMDPDLTEHVPHGRRNTEPPRVAVRAPLPQRSNTAPSSSQNYERMVHPNASLHQDGYVAMVPVPGLGMAIHRPIVPSHYDVPPPFRKRPGTNGDSSLPSSSSPSTYENCGHLPTIEEAPKRNGRSEVYENFPRPAEVVAESFVQYRPNYENVDVLNEQRRNSESYQNVPLDAGSRDEQKRASTRSRSRSTEKEDVQLPLRGRNTTPPNSDMHFSYAKHHTHSTADAPPVPPRIPVVRDTTTTS